MVRAHEKRTSNISMVLLLVVFIKASVAEEQSATQCTNTKA